ncbi:mannitol dehydrogenase [Streptomyces daqingensis]|uniref:Mannitol dehydrogenase n=1 Tax=Streptomyces daqingensis TaxID=1472640 RepID=A0ABQ2LU07_9ACTN|nr:mannitol dehydrogenase family protein [Streptomyces daqingensis]GGO43076.1 mannitol dehydrogenase [Streptomyces daqingensis]
MTDAHAGGPGARRILHLGLGNFHRAHQALYTEDAARSGGPWTITGAAGSTRGVVEALRRQGMRYHVLTLGPGQTDVREVASITDAFVAADEPGRTTAEIADPATRIVSLTVTEKGYGISARTGGLDLDAPAVRDDVAGSPPRSTVGRLAAGLLRRCRASAEPVTLLSCDNLTANGTTLAGLLRDFAGAMPARDGAELLAFLDESVTCPDTMVDRIVPATTDEHRRMAAEAGFDDEVPVPAEPFTMWVMRDDFAAGRPAWEKAGAVLTDRVHDYETAKVRLLNGVHSLLAYLGMLTGRELIADAAADPVVARAAERLGDEYEPTLVLPGGFDVAAYRRELRERFANRRLAHGTAQVGADGSLKLAQRVPGAVLWHRRHGTLPAVLALTVAAWLKCLAHPAALPGGRALADPNAERLRAKGERAARGGTPERRGHELARLCLREEALLGQELGGQDEFVAAVGELLAELERGGVAAAVEAATGSSAGGHRSGGPDVPSGGP